MPGGRRDPPAKLARPAWAGGRFGPDADAACDAVLGRARISVTDLARSKEWRERLPEAGVIEVADRGETAAWLLSDEDMRAIVEGYAYLESELEREQVAALFEARRDSLPKSGDELRAAALAAFDARKDALAEVVSAR